jgi:gamma-glutamyl hydrolase
MAPVSVLLCACALLSASATLASAQKINDRPIMGILTQPSTGTGLPGDSYVAASYVKFAEAGGMRAVPVFHNGTTEYLTKTFQSINGLFFPGGGANIAEGSQLRKAADLLFSLALKANDAGDYFPVFAHCMGFELVSLIVSEDPHVLRYICSRLSPAVLGPFVLCLFHGVFLTLFWRELLSGKTTPRVCGGTQK